MDQLIKEWRESPSEFSKDVCFDIVKKIFQ